MCRDAYGFVTPRPRTVVGPWGHRIADEVDHKKTTDTVRVPYQECKPRGGHFRLDIVSVIADFGIARLTQFRRTSTKSIHNSTASCQRQKEEEEKADTKYPQVYTTKKKGKGSVMENYNGNKASADALGVTLQSSQVQGLLDFAVQCDDSALNVLRWEIVVCRWNGNCSIIIIGLMEDAVLAMANKQIAFKNYNNSLDLQGL